MSVKEIAAAERARLEEKLKVKGTITFGDNGKAAISKDFTIENLPEGLTAEQFKASFDHLDNVIHASASVFGHSSIEHLKKNKDLDVTQLRIPTVGRSYIEHAVQRSKPVRAPGSTEETIVHGALSTKVTVYSTKNRGEMARIREELAAAATKSLGGK